MNSATRVFEGRISPVIEEGTPEWEGRYSGWMPNHGHVAITFYRADGLSFRSQDVTATQRLMEEALKFLSNLNQSRWGSYVALATGTVYTVEPKTEEVQEETNVPVLD